MQPYLHAQFVCSSHCYSLVLWGEGLCINIVSLSLVSLAGSMANCNAKIGVDLLFRYLHAAGLGLLPDVTYTTRLFLELTVSI